MFISGNGTNREVREVVDCVTVRRLLSELLSGNFFGCEETATWTTGATHGVLVARLVEIRLSLPGKPVNFF